MCRLAVTFVCYVQIASLAGGCGRNGPERVIITGTVTYQGEPLEHGEIRFIPIEGTKAPVSGAAIDGGEYVVSGRGGVPVGTHKIEIVAHRVDPKYAGSADSLSQDVDGAPPRQQYLPERYNVHTELQIVIEPGSREIISNFDLHN